VLRGYVERDNLSKLTELNKAAADLVKSPDQCIDGIRVSLHAYTIAVESEAPVG
jgi:hypothetical protein